jgi:hypothetical protein
MADLFANNDSDPITSATQNTESAFHISKTEPITKPFHVLPSNTEPTKLSKGAIAGIVIGCLVGLGLILFLILFFTLRSKNNNGDAKFGAIQYGDSKTGASGPFKPKESITIKYLPKVALNSVKFSVSTDSGSTFTVLPINSGSTNTTTWTIPETVFSETCFFQVEDGTNAQDFLRTNYFSVIPQIILISGPGATRVDSVYVNVTASVQLDFDSVIPDLNVVADWDLTFSVANKEKFTPVFSGTVQAITPGTGTANGTGTTNQVSWIIPTVPPNPNIPYYWRLTTKNLKAFGYPSELYVESNNPINIVNAPPPPPGTFALGVKDNISGSIAYYVPGDAVTIRVLSTISMSGITFTYFDGTANTPLTPTGPGVVVDSNTTDYPWTIPDTVFTDKFSVSATLSTGVTATSPTGTVEPFFSWNQPQAGTVVNSYVAAAPYSYMMQTTIAFRGSLTFTNWEVGFIDAFGVYQALATKTQAGTTVTIDWSATQEKLSLNPDISGLPNNTVNYKFYVRVSNAAGQTTTIATPAEVIWNGVYWVPTLSVLQSSSTLFPSYATAQSVNETYLQFTTNDANQAAKLFSVSVGQPPQPYTYIIYRFPDVRPLPEVFNFDMLQPSLITERVILKQNVSIENAILLTPFNSTGSTAQPYGLYYTFIQPQITEELTWNLPSAGLGEIFFQGTGEDNIIFNMGQIVSNINIQSAP